MYASITAIKSFFVKYISISGPGALRLPNIPKQFETFKGPWCHSAVWDHSIDLDNKVVGIVGSGTSAVQIIPSIAKRVKELHVFQRRSAWVVPRHQFEFSQFVKTMFAYIPFLMLLYRLYIYLVNELNYYGFKTNSFLGKLGEIFNKLILTIIQICQSPFFVASKASLQQLKNQVPDNEKLRNSLTPTFAFGCKRLMLTNDYYPALNLSHVTVHCGKIDKVSDDSIKMENGVTQKLDVRQKFLGGTAINRHFLLLGSYFSHGFSSSRFLCTTASYREEF